MGLVKFADLMRSALTSFGKRRNRLGQSKSIKAGAPVRSTKWRLFSRASRGLAFMPRAQTLISALRLPQRSMRLAKWVLVNLNDPPPRLPPQRGFQVVRGHGCSGRSFLRLGICKGFGGGGVSVLCLLGVHRHTHRIDFGLDRAMQLSPDNVAFVYYSSEYVVCSRCGGTEKARRRHERYPFLIPATKGIN